MPGRATETGESLGLAVTQPSFRFNARASLKEKVEGDEVRRPATPTSDLQERAWAHASTHKCFYIPSHFDSPNKRLLEGAEMEKLAPSHRVCSNPVLGTHGQIRTSERRQDGKQV